MEKVFNPDSRLMKFLTLMYELMILNLLTALMCLPVITAGASLTAMHSVLLSIVRREDGYVTKQFWKEFRRNLKQATAVWTAVLALAACLYFVKRAADGISAGNSVYISIGMIMFAVFMFLSWFFPVTAHFENTIAGEIRTSVTLMAGCLPRTLGMAAVKISFAFIYANCWKAMLPAIVLVGITAPAAICARIYDPIFTKLEKNAGDGSSHQY